MRKLGISLFSCIALVAFMGFSAPAFAVPQMDPDCVPDNVFAVTGFDINTTNRHANQITALGDVDVSNTPAGRALIGGEGLACGGLIDNGGVGIETLNRRAAIDNPPGALLRAMPNPDVPHNTFVGKTRADSLLFAAGAIRFAIFGEDVIATVRAWDPTVNDPSDGTQPECPQTALACYRAQTDPGYPAAHAYIWSEDGTNFIIGEFNTDFAGGMEAGLTDIDDLGLCQSAGDAPGGTTCGSNPAKWVSTTGNVPGGNYSVVVTNRNDDSTAPVTTFEPWHRHHYCSGSSAPKPSSGGPQPSDGVSPLAQPPLAQAAPPTTVRPKSIGPIEACEIPPSEDL